MVDLPLGINTLGGSNRTGIEEGFELCKKFPGCCIEAPVFPSVELFNSFLQVLHSIHYFLSPYFCRGL